MLLMESTAPSLTRTVSPATVLPESAQVLPVFGCPAGGRAAGVRAAGDRQLPTSDFPQSPTNTVSPATIVPEPVHATPTPDGHKSTMWDLDTDSGWPANDPDRSSQHNHYDCPPDTSDLPQSSTNIASPTTIPAEQAQFPPTSSFLNDARMTEAREFDNRTFTVPDVVPDFGWPANGLAHPSEYNNRDDFPDDCWQTPVLDWEDALGGVMSVADPMVLYTHWEDPSVDIPKVCEMTPKLGKPIKSCGDLYLNDDDAEVSEPPPCRSS